MEKSVRKFDMHSLSKMMSLYTCVLEKCLKALHRRSCTWCSLSFTEGQEQTKPVHTRTPHPRLQSQAHPLSFLANPATRSTHTAARHAPLSCSAAPTMLGWAPPPWSDKVCVVRGGERGVGWETLPGQCWTIALGSAGCSPESVPASYPDPT